LDEETINTEKRWESESIIQNATSVKLIVEVVSTAVALSRETCPPKLPGFNITTQQIFDLAKKTGNAEA
jgi:hypothetical protein